MFWLTNIPGGAVHMINLSKHKSTLHEPLLASSSHRGHQQIWTWPKVLKKTESNATLQWWYLVHKCPTKRDIFSTLGEVWWQRHERRQETICASTIEKNGMLRSWLKSYLLMSTQRSDLVSSHKNTDKLRWQEELIISSNNQSSPNFVRQDFVVVGAMQNSLIRSFYVWADLIQLEQFIPMDKVIRGPYLSLVAVLALLCSVLKTEPDFIQRT